MVRATWDDTVFKNKLRIVRSRRDKARTKSLIQLGKRFAQVAYQISPADTRRYVNALAQACNAAGIGPLPVLPLRPSKFKDKHGQKLRRQIAKYDTLLQLWYGATWTDDLPTKNAGKNGKAPKWFKRLKRYRRRAAEELAKFEGDEAGTALYIGGNTRRIATVRTKVYGGTGRIISGADDTVIYLHNKEPHANLVERRVRVIWRAIRVAKGRGPLKRMRNTYVKEVAAGTGMAA